MALGRALDPNELDTYCAVMFDVKSPTVSEEEGWDAPTEENNDASCVGTYVLKSSGVESP